MQGLSILLVEDSALFRNALVNVFSQAQTLSLTVCSSGSFLKRMTNINHHAVVIDAVTWAAGLEQLVGAVETAARITPVILLGRDDSLDKYLEPLRAGAAGFVNQTAAPKVLIKAVKAVVAGDVWYERKLFRKILAQATNADIGSRTIHLSEKERQILALVAGGKTNKEIGALLGLGERTIKAHVSNLFCKTGVANRCGLACYAMSHGFAHSTQE